jgi:hypothetical protein
MPAETALAAAVLIEISLLLPAIVTLPFLRTYTGLALERRRDRINYRRQ